MINNADIALIAINKFFFYAMNYPCVPITYKSIDGTEKKDYLPSFFKAFPPYLVEHLKGKWNYACEQYGSYGAMMKFYGELDGDNRNLMLNHIIDTYNGEQRIPLNDEMAERNQPLGTDIAEPTIIEIKIEIPSTEVVTRKLMLE